MYIWESKLWPMFVFDTTLIESRLNDVLALQKQLIGKAKRLPENSDRQAEMDALTDKNPALERTVCETRIPLPPKPKDVAKSVKSTRIAAGEKATGYTVEPGLNTVWVDNLDISKWNQTIDNADNKQDESPVRRIATQEVDYMLVTDETTPYSVESRKDYSLKLRGCVATLIHKNWAMTAAHCIPRRKVRHPNKIKVGYLNESGKYSYVRAKKVFKKKKADIALIQLKSSIERVEPVLMLNDRLKPQDKMIKIKKVSRKKSWSNIPARASKKKKVNLFVPKRFRKGKAGTSGSPWVYHSTAGDVNTWRRKRKTSWICF
ncbi:MAG: hypothetical protein DSZ12_05065 [Sulfurovum sp.]|nr:MAG: hypothetical protein DSZ12_05065 [Sulfurovum sp.]